jgi:hypothetical protein
MSSEVTGMPTKRFGSGSDGSNRIAMITWMLLDNRRRAGMLPENAEEFKLTMATWTDALEAVETAWLKDCFKRAHLAHEGTRLLTPWEVVSIWKQVKANGEVEERRKAHLLARPPCALCNGSGWELRREGNREGVVRCRCGR